MLFKGENKRDKGKKKLLKLSSIWVLGRKQKPAVTTAFEYYVHCTETKEKQQQQQQNNNKIHELKLILPLSFTPSPNSSTKQKSENQR